MYYTKTLIKKSSIMPIFIEIIKFDFDMQWICNDYWNAFILSSFISELEF